LVVLDIEHAYGKHPESPAMVLAKSIFESRDLTLGIGIEGFGGGAGGRRKVGRSE
jgi:hypothetical protein